MTSYYILNMIKLLLILLLIIFILVLSGAGCERPRAFLGPPGSVSQTVQSMVSRKFVTSDGVTIAADYLKPVGAASAVLLLHMMPATKESWQPLTELLNKKGLATLAIDLRGHGESTVGVGGRELDYKKFSDVDQQTKKLDVSAGLEFLKREGFALPDITLVGASIGANLALQALAEHSEIKKAAALSPGLDYKGVVTKSLLEKIATDQQVFLIASEDDSYSADSARALAETNPRAKLKIYDRAGHGTNMWFSQPALLPELVEWLTQ